MDDFRSAPPHPAPPRSAVASSAPDAAAEAPSAPDPQGPPLASASTGESSPPAGQQGAPAPSPEILRANLADFALDELVRQHRTSFGPPWSVESWAKLLIWLALNSGCAGDTASLEAFAASLGPERSGRLRRLFFSREFEASGLRLLADPAEGQVQLQGDLSAAADATSPQSDLEPVAAALEAAGLTDLVEPERRLWQRRVGLVVIPRR